MTSVGNFVTTTAKKLNNECVGFHSQDIVFHSTKSSCWRVHPKRTGIPPSYSLKVRPLIEMVSDR